MEPSDQEKRVRSLESQVAELARRIERLESESGRGSRRRTRPPVKPAADDLSLLQRLRSRRGRRYRAKGARGAVAYAGAASFGNRECLWIMEHALPELVALEPNRLARALAALGHPSRLILLRALMRKPRGSQELQEVLGISSPGQLYHHLKELLSTGLVRQTGRSQYEIADRQIVPLLAVLAAVSDLVDSTIVAPHLDELPGTES